MSWLFGAFAVTLVLGIPVIFVLGISALVYFLFTGQPHMLLVVPQRMFSGIDQFVLLAIPLFVLAGNIMSGAGLTQRLLDFANIWVGRFRGGVSLTAIWGSFLFGGVSGSAAADAAALGSVLIPEMKRQGYEPGYSSGLIAVSSIMAPLVPPSIAMIIYGALSGTSIARLLIAGIVPGVLLAIGLTVYAVWIARRRGYPTRPAASWDVILHASIKAGPIMLLPLLIIVGIRGGVFTATEAAAVAVIYAFLLAALLYRTLDLARLRRALLDTALMSSAIYLLMAMASITAFILANEQLPQTIVNGLFAITENKILLLLLVNAVLLVLGMFLDITGVLVLAVPALVGVGQALGLDPVHLGIMVVFNLLLGFVTPPVGLCLFIVANIARLRMEAVAVSALPMLGVALAVLLIITFVPEIVLFLPNLIIR